MSSRKRTQGRLRLLLGEVDPIRAMKGRVWGVWWMCQGDSWWAGLPLRFHVVLEEDAEGRCGRLSPLSRCHRGQHGIQHLRKHDTAWNEGKCKGQPCVRHVVWKIQGRWIRSVQGLNARL